MTDSILNAQRLQQIKGLHSLSPSFRNELDKLVDSEITKAKTLISQLFKLSLDGTSEEKPVNIPKKRGRPPGSKSKVPNKPRAKKENVIDPSISTTTSEVTHKIAIASALAGNSDGLAAGEIMSAIQAAKHKKYKAPTIQTLYTVLHGLKAKGMLKMLGDKPHTKYTLA